MSTAKLKLLAAAVGLVGTGLLPAAGQDKKPAPPAKAEAGKPDPVWNKDDKVPSLFPDVKPIGRKDGEIDQFIEERAKQGVARQADLLAVRRYRIDAEIAALEKAWSREMLAR